MEVSGPLNLLNLGASMKLTRSLFTLEKKDGRYTDEDMVENRGVLPDKEQQLSTQDILEVSMESYGRAVMNFAVDHAEASSTHKATPVE